MVANSSLIPTNNIQNSSLSSITDFNVNTPTTGQLLKYANNKWINANPTNILDNITLYTPQANDVLQYYNGKLAFMASSTGIYTSFDLVNLGIY